METYAEIVARATNEFAQLKEMKSKIGYSQEIVALIDQAQTLLSKMNIELPDSRRSLDYVGLFHSPIITILNILKLPNLPTNNPSNQSNEPYEMRYRAHLEARYNQMKVILDGLDFTFNFFSKIGFFDNNVVAVGANGSGKSTLAQKFRGPLRNNGVVISAQRVLLISQFNSMVSQDIAIKNLQASQKLAKTYKEKEEYNHLSSEFNTVLTTLSAENFYAGHSYRKQNVEREQNGLQLEPAPKTNLDRTMEIWNSLIGHRRIGCTDGMNITVSADSDITYEAIQMSDGEKVMLYLIAQVLLAPLNGFIVIDEPEMYLHKTVLSKLWDKLEAERPDCLFIYLTHDLAFASTRTNAKKIWIKSFNHPDKWEIETIPENEIPEALMMELLGSRKNILFCEGKKGSIDESIYSILLPDFTLSPVGGCLDVINYTKAFNRITNLTTKAYGLTDSDHHPQERINNLESDNIFSLPMAEAENLLLDEEFLTIAANQWCSEPSILEQIKEDVLRRLDAQKELQAANFVTAKIHYYFKDSHLSEGNDLDRLLKNYEVFLEKINIEMWYQERLEYLKKVVLDQDYRAAISAMNDKGGLQAIVEKNLGVKDFAPKAIQLLKTSEPSRVAILRHLPEQIIKEITPY